MPVSRTPPETQTTSYPSQDEPILQEHSDKGLEERSLLQNQPVSEQNEQFATYLRDDLISVIRKPQLPAFMRDRPDIWFILIETEFRANRITGDESKFSATLRALDTETLQQITDMIYRPPEKDKYETLKKIVVQRLSDSRQKQIQRLLNELVLGDKRPSQLLREMRDLAAGGITEDMLHTLWLNRLPSHLRPLLVASESLDLKAVAEMADRMMEITCSNSPYIMKTSQSVNSVENVQFSISKFEKRMDDFQSALTLCLSQMTKLMAQAVQNGSQQHRGRPRSRSRTPDNRGICYFHKKFGKEAHKLKKGKLKPKVSDLTLYAANTSPIKTFGTINLVVDLNLRRDFTWPFIIAEVEEAIIGADFLNHFNLLIDLRNRRLIDSITGLTTKGQLETVKCCSVSTVEYNSPYANLLQEFIEITRVKTVPYLKVTEFAHRIVTNGPPVTERPRKLAGEKAKAAKAEIQRLLDAGICRPSSSPWASPIHMVKKKNETWRLCGDYRKVNDITMPDKYSPPLVQSLFTQLDGNKIFSTIDLEKAYHQIPMFEEDVKKTAITTPWGLFEYLTMPFGLKNATQTFQSVLIITTTT
ncbi:uncharacterized protein [Prorops nasuta]|uniref:uncharacterized protein n=1 Tax=Prorops nasuta TaxID=863751 RepID=UPI0034CD62F8